MCATEVRCVIWVFQGRGAGDQRQFHIKTILQRLVATTLGGLRFLSGLSTASRFTPCGTL